MRRAICNQCVDRGQQGCGRGVEDEDKQIWPGAPWGHFQRDGEGGRRGEYLCLHDKRGVHVKDHPCEKEIVPLESLTKFFIFSISPIQRTYIILSHTNLQRSRSLAIHYFFPISSKTMIASSPRNAWPNLPPLHSLIFYYFEKEDGRYCLQLLSDGSSSNCLYNLATKLLQK